MINETILTKLPVAFTGQASMLRNSFGSYWETLCDELPANGGYWKIDDATNALAQTYKLSLRTARQYALAVIRYVQLESGSNVIVRVGNRYRFA